MILAIDPGNEMSAYVLLDKDLKPIKFEKAANEYVKTKIIRLTKENYTVNNAVKVVIERIASYGMPVGETVFDTCIWVGRFAEIAEQCGSLVHYIYRKDEKMNLCGTMKAKDSNIRQALIDRFGIVGTKKAPGFFYGFKADIWAAMAVGVTFYDLHLKGEYNGKSI